MAEQKKKFPKIMKIAWILGLITLVLGFAFSLSNPLGILLTVGFAIGFFGGSVFLYDSYSCYKNGFARWFPPTGGDYSFGTRSIGDGLVTIKEKNPKSFYIATAINFGIGIILLIVGLACLIWLFIWR